MFTVFPEPAAKPTATEVQTGSVELGESLSLVDDIVRRRAWRMLGEVLAAEELIVWFVDERDEAGGAWWCATAITASARCSSAPAPGRSLRPAHHVTFAVGTAGPVSDRSAAQRGMYKDRIVDVVDRGRFDRVESVLRHQTGIDPRHLGQVLDLAAVGIVDSAWRNGPVEDWHAADGALTDGSVLRIRRTHHVAHPRDRAALAHRDRPHAGLADHHAR